MEPTERKPYSEPQVVYESMLEIRAGSPPKVADGDGDGQDAESQTDNNPGHPLTNQSGRCGAYWNPNNSNPNPNMPIFGRRNYK